MPFSDFDRDCMHRALELAERGRGTTHPNPLVGAVVAVNGRIVGEGYHQQAGGPHAEIEALVAAGRKAHGATLYVTLEPCCHTGRTGPCTDRIAKAGIRRVVYAMTDPDPRVNARGARRLRELGIEVQSGLLRGVAQYLNEIHLLAHTQRRAYVTLKMAQTLDGYVATDSGESRWISSPMARQMVHQMRAEHDAVIVGGETVRADNPRLTVRLVKGPNPFRIVVTASGNLPPGATLLTDNRDGRTIIATTRAGMRQLLKRPIRRSLHLWEIPSRRNSGIALDELLKAAYQFGMRSVLVEGGPSLAAGFLRQRLVDKYVAVISPTLLGSGKQVLQDFGIRKLNRRAQLILPRVGNWGGDMVVVGKLEY